MSVTLLGTTNNILPQRRQYLPRHTLALNRLRHLLSNFTRHATRHALEINMIAIRHVGHGGRSMDMSAVGGYGTDGRNHNLPLYRQ
jgi:hypothetical protein